jgi:hypothetical protein
MLTAKINTKGFQRNVVDSMKKQVPFALSHAINKTMSTVRKDQIKKMDEVFEGGATRYTKGSARVQYSNKRNLTSYLYYDVGSRPYMRTMLYGGTVKPSKRKLVEPAFNNGKSAARLNKFGNLGKDFIKNNKEKSDRYFIGIPKGRPNTDQYYGLWRRSGKGGKDKRGRSRGKMKLIVSMAKTKREQTALFHSSDYAKSEFMARIYRQIPASFRYARRTGSKRTKNLRFR